MSEGEHVDLGDVLLDPCGVLVVGVKDPSENPIESFRVDNILPDGTVESRRPMWSHGRIGREKMQFGNIPFGRSRIRISCSGLRRPNGVMQRDFHEKEVEIDCRPGEPVEISIVLQPK